MRSLRQLGVAAAAGAVLAVALPPVVLAGVLVEVEVALRTAYAGWRARLVDDAAAEVQARLVEAAVQRSRDALDREWRALGLGEPPVWTAKAHP